MNNKEMHQTNTEIYKGLLIEQLYNTQEITELANLEAAAFKGVGEDMFTLVTLAKIGWIWGVREHGKLIGAIELFRQGDSNKGFIHGVVVDPDIHNNGLGSKLVEYTEVKALSHGMNTIEATIAPTNGASLRTFLNHHGYKGVGYLPDCYGTGEHRLWVVKNVDENGEQFNYHHMLKKQDEEGSVFFVEDDDYKSLSELMDGKGLSVVGVVKPNESGMETNLLCLV